MTNDPITNKITVFDRANDGTLTRRALESTPTGGMGTGGAEDSANGLILANVDGEVSPTRTKGSGTYLLALNGGSNDITVFRTGPGGLTKVDQEPSNGTRPISITVNRGVAYVLNAGTFMCTGLVEQPNITGFTFDAKGQLTPIPGSTRPLSGLPNSGCTQVAFDKTGKVVIVDEQQADVITTYTRNSDGTLSAPTAQQSTGNGPFGLNFTQRNQLLTTENFGALPGQGALTSYAIDEKSGTLTSLSPSVSNAQSDTCWVVITNDNKYAFTSSFGDDGGISSYRVRPDGSLELLNAQAATVGGGSSDMTLSRDSRFLYVKNTLMSTVTGFRVEDDGSLTKINALKDDSVTGSIGLAGL
ncbi:MAG: lactonase family protein [Actinomycetota bacterium]|nr:lactonase family protein [Actinomycetota bacterium]